MKTKQRTKMKDGTDIQIEDWSEDYSCYKPYDTVVAYPISKRTTKWGWIREGESFRLAMRFSSESDSQDAYEKLLSGEKTFTDYLENIDPKYRKCI